MKIAALIILTILAALDILLVAACLKTSGDCSREEEKEDAKRKETD